MSGITRFIKRVCVQTAVYWEAKGSDGYGGMSYEIPVEIKCRWDGKSQVIVASDGKEIVSQAQLLVTEDLGVESRVMLGTLEELLAGAWFDPLKAEGTYEVLKIDKTPLFRSTSEFVRKVYL